MPYLLASDVLIDISRGRARAIDYVDTLPDPWVISRATAMELLFGARDKREISYIDTFLSSYPIIPLTDSIGGTAYYLIERYAKSHGLHVNALSDLAPFDSLRS